MLGGAALIIGHGNGELIAAEPVGIGGGVTPGAGLGIDGGSTIRSLGGDGKVGGIRQAIHIGGIQVTADHGALVSTSADIPGDDRFVFDRVHRDPTARGSDTDRTRATAAAARPGDIDVVKVDVFPGCIHSRDDAETEQHVVGQRYKVLDHHAPCSRRVAHNRALAKRRPGNAPIERDTSRNRIDGAAAVGIEIQCQCRANRIGKVGTTVDVFGTSAVLIIDVQLVVFDTDITGGCGAVIINLGPGRRPHVRAIVRTIGCNIEFITDRSRCRYVDDISIGTGGLIPGMEGNAIGHSAVPVRIGHKAYVGIGVTGQQSHIGAAGRP